MARTIAKDYGEKRLLILKAAAEVFAREGIARAPMSEVAKNCGISKANIYHYYSSKDSLLFDILDSYLSSLSNHICNLPLDNLSAKDKLSAITREVLFAYDGMDHQHKIQTEGLPLLRKEQQEILKQYQRNMVAVVNDVLIEIVPPKIKHNRMVLRNINMSLFGMLNWYYIWNPNADRKAREEYAITITELTVSGAAHFEIIQ
ncbi:MAG: TetR family transcriptional regulator [Rhodobacteraceae bacterium]|nr:TetR family transcriptional regulator [Paracoccaceae bacterium]